MLERIRTLSCSTVEVNDGDYQDGDGFWVCGKCGTRKEGEYEFVWGLSRVPVMCKCRAEESERKRERMRRIQDTVKRQYMIADGMEDIGYRNRTFAADDSADSGQSLICRDYLANWETHQRTGTGLLLYGDVGTGKTFYACCIANALIDKGCDVYVTNFPSLLDKLQSGERFRTMDRIRDVDLLCIDDLGVERDTPTAIEYVYKVIDTRYRSSRPLVVTTNLSVHAMQSADTKYLRIYDRVLGMCQIRARFSGPSRRIRRADKTPIATQPEFPWR